MFIICEIGFILCMDIVWALLRNKKKGRKVITERKPRRGTGATQREQKKRDVKGV